eukprot:scaffold591_cov174-Ochromonas_danica.AAC.1
MLTKEEELNDNNSTTSSLFRQRFRIPYPVFKKILEELKADPKFADHDNKTDAVGNQAVPLAIKLLGTLRILTRSSTFDQIAELSDVGIETTRTFFYEFISFYSGDDVYSRYVYEPKSKGTLKVVEREYRRKGLPGCVGSVNCVHIAWETCPPAAAAAAAAASHKEEGKEIYKSVAFEVVVDHSGRIMSTTVPSFTGSCWNDKKIILFDGFVSKLRRGQVCQDIDPVQEWNYYEKSNHHHQLELDATNGKPIVLLKTEKGYYLISNDRYHQWRVLQCPDKLTAHPEEMRWSLMVDSMRKDVECTFRMLKNRFNILKYPLRYHKQEMIWNIFRTCCVLHNILLDFNGKDLVKIAERKEAAAAAAGLLEEDEEEIAVAQTEEEGGVILSLVKQQGGDAREEDVDDEERDGEEIGILVQEVIQAHDNDIREELAAAAVGDHTGVGRYHLDVIDVKFAVGEEAVETVEEEAAHQILRRKLMTHYSIIRHNSKKQQQQA